MSHPVLSLPIEGVWISRLTTTTPHPLDDHVEGIRNRSEDAFRHVYDALADDLASFAYGMLSDRRTAEDVVQQSFVELVRAAHKIKGDGRALRAWLYKSVRYRCLDEYRRRSRRPEIPQDVLPDVVVESDPLADQLDPELEVALLTLNKRQRTALVLRHVVGLSGEEIAEVIGSTRRATYALLDRAEAKLRAELGEKA